jgi:hypothetical protein
MDGWHVGGSAGRGRADLRRGRRAAPGRVGDGRSLATADADSAGLTQASGVYEATRRPRTNMVQATSDANSFGRYNNQVDWIYGYDAWSVPLAEPGVIEVGA